MVLIQIMCYCHESIDFHNCHHCHQPHPTGCVMSRRFQRSNFRGTLTTSSLGRWQHTLSRRSAPCSLLSSRCTIRGLTHCICQTVGCEQSDIPPNMSCTGTPCSSYQQEGILWSFPSVGYDSLYSGGEFNEVRAFAFWNVAGCAALGGDDRGGPRTAICAGRSLVCRTPHQHWRLTATPACAYSDQRELCL